MSYFILLWISWMWISLSFGRKTLGPQKVAFRRKSRIFRLFTTFEIRRVCLFVCALDADDLSPRLVTKRLWYKSQALLSEPDERSVPMLVKVLWFCVGRTANKMASGIYELIMMAFFQQTNLIDNFDNERKPNFCDCQVTMTKLWPSRRACKFETQICVVYIKRLLQ